MNQVVELKQSIVPASASLDNAEQPLVTNSMIEQLMSNKPLSVVLDENEQKLVALAMYHTNVSVLSVKEFIRVTGYNIDALMVDRFWNQLSNNELVYVDNELLSWCGFSGTLGAQRSHLTRILKMNNIKYIKYNNDDYSKFLLSQIGQQDFPIPDISHGKGRMMHLLLPAREFKKALCRVNTERGREIREYYMAVDELLQIYVKYQTCHEMAEMTRERTRLETMVANQNNMLMANARKLDEITDQNDRLLTKVDDLNATIDDLSNNLHDAGEERAPRTKDIRLHHRFIILKIDRADFDIEDIRGMPDAQFYVIRAQARACQNRLDTFMADHQHTTVFFDVMYSPHAGNLYNLIKQELGSRGSKQIKTNGNYVKLINGYTTEQFGVDVKRIEETKHEDTPAYSYNLTE